ncbi:MAG: hypothetical protein ABIG44_03805 [Planctomycetota bacterium]
MNSTPTPKTRLDFHNLPLIEAALRASLSEAVSVSYNVVNSIKNLLEPEFSTLSAPQQLEVAPGFGPSPAEFGPSSLPGAVYGGHNAGLTVSVHPKVIVARWIKQPGLSEMEYPRYPALRDALWKAVDALAEGLGDDAFPGVAVVNMSYVNFLPATDPSSVVSNYFSEKAHLSLMDDARQIRKLEAGWSEHNRVDVRFALEQVTAKLGDSVHEGYRLTTAAGIRLAGSLNAQRALEEIHEYLQVFFLKLISDHAKQEWMLKEVAND